MTIIPRRLQLGGLFAVVFVILAAACLLSAPPALAYTDKELQDLDDRRLEQTIGNMDSENYWLVENSVFKFEQMGDEAIPILMKLIIDKSSSKRRVSNAIYALGRLGATARLAVPTIMPFLKNEDKDMQGVALTALGKIGAQAKDAVPGIIPLLMSDDPWLSRSAREALLQIRTRPALQAVKDFDKVKGK